MATQCLAPDGERAGGKMEKVGHDEGKKERKKSVVGRKAVCGLWRVGYPGGGQNAATGKPLACSRSKSWHASISQRTCVVKLQMHLACWSRAPTHKSIPLPASR